MKQKSINTMEGKNFNCDNCTLRKKAELKPKSFIGWFWRWHTGWCPGWKAYQRHLAENAG